MDIFTFTFYLALASADIFGSDSHGTRNHNLLSLIRDFSFRRLLRLAGLRWRYSTPPPHGSSLSQVLKYGSTFYNCGTNWIEITTSNSSSVVLLLIRCPGNTPSDPLSNNGRLLRFFSDCTLPAFRRFVTLFFREEFFQGILLVGLSIVSVKILLFQWHKMKKKTYQIRPFYFSRRHLDIINLIPF
jgi:hypothetical protein